MPISFTHQEKTRTPMRILSGYEFNGYDEKISAKARKNLDEALVFMKQVLVNCDFVKHVSLSETMSGKDKLLSKTEMRKSYER